MAELKFEKVAPGGSWYWARPKVWKDEEAMLLIEVVKEGWVIIADPSIDLDDSVSKKVEDWLLLAKIERPKKESTAADITKLYGYDIDFNNNPQWPAFNPPVQVSPGGNPYFERPGVVLLMKPQVNIENARYFVESFDAVDPKLKFKEYFKDPMPFSALPPGMALVKFAGQVCYLSFDPGDSNDKESKGAKRTWNKDAQKYVDNALGQTPAHGSLIEHPNYSILFYGVSRSFSHELVRHRAGAGYSQTSQRFVDGRKLRFVCRPEYQADQILMMRFQKRIDHLATEYDETADYLRDKQAGPDAGLLSGEKRVELKKKVQQCARSALPNETEAPIVVTGNARAIRHMIEMRANPAAEIEIRGAFARVAHIMKLVEPQLFNDHKIVALPDGTMGVETPWRKV